MEGSIYLEKIKFKNGYNLSLKRDSIVLFVGANNSGKSVTLREIYLCLLENSNINNVSVESVEVATDGTFQNFKDNNSNLLQNTSYHAPTTHGSFSEGNLQQSWIQCQKAVLSQYNVKILNTSDRLNLVSPPGSIDLVNQPPKHPFHVLQLNEEMLTNFGEHFKRAFNIDITLNFGAGSNVPLHVGKKPTLKKKQDRVSSDYLRELKELPQLQNQGDGMKSFTGVFLSLIAEKSYGISLIDEPEAFLHPPQARLLGQMIGKDVSQSKQILIATHSEHFLKGILEYAEPRLIVVRLKREQSKVEQTSLINTDLQHIWRDSILKNTNILDGLFHSKVVLCESDSDCLFFSAMASSIAEATKLSSPDIHYIHCGGKDRFPVVMKALRKINVPLTVIGDFDLYNNERPLKQMYEIMGGTWNSIEKDFLKVKQNIDSQRPELNTKDAKKALDDIFSSITTPNLLNEQIKNLQSVLKKSSAWTKAKSLGKSILASGDVTNSFNSLNSALEKVGIIIIQTGEIESFDKRYNSHGPKWVNEVLQNDLVNDPNLENARIFVKKNILFI